MWSLIIALVLGVVTFVAYNVNKVRKLLKSVEHLPGPPSHPVFGNAQQIGSDTVSFLKNLFKWWEAYGPSPYKLRLLNTLFIIVTDPKDIEVILTSTPQLRKADVYDFFRPWLGDGLLTSYGTKWHKHRKVITPSFHFSILNIHYFDVINETSSRLISKLSKKSATNEIFNVQALIHYCTLDIICETAMGVNLDSMNDPKSKVVKAYQEICSLITIRSFSPLFYNDILYMLSPDYWKQKKALDILRTFTSGVIEKRRKLLESNKNIGSKPNTNDYDVVKSEKMVFLDTLLTCTIDNAPMSDSEIFEEVSTFMFEGHDTTTSGITFATYLLARHPEVQQKVLQEQEKVIGKDLKRIPKYQDLASMKYLEMVIKESQRMYPSVPFVGRMVDEKFNLNGTELLPGTALNLFLIGMGYNEKYFPEPHKFRPERFETQNRASSHPFDYVPFSAGPRNCIGQKFAMMEMKCILSKFVRNFEILPAVDDLPPFKGYDVNCDVGEHEPLLSALLTLKSQHGVNVRLRTRK